MQRRVRRRSPSQGLIVPTAEPAPSAALRRPGAGLDALSCARRAASGLEAGVVGGLAMLSRVDFVFSPARARVVGVTEPSGFHLLRSPRVSFRRRHGDALRRRISSGDHGNRGRGLWLASAEPWPAARGLLLVGLTSGVVWYYLANALLWSQRQSPGAALYFPPAAWFLTACSEPAWDGWANCSGVTRRQRDRFRIHRRLEGSSSEPWYGTQILSSNALD